MRARPTLLRRGVLAVTVLLLLAPALSVPVTSQDGDHAPHVSRIRSILDPPFNYYSVEVNDPDGDALTFTWSISEAGACGAYFGSSGGNRSEWRHDDPEDCPHDASSHPGTITVVVTDGTYDVTRVYEGGSAPYEPPEDEDWDDPDYAPPGGSTTRTDDGDDPSDTGDPDIYGEELECGATDVKGAFEPVQAVYQDDPDFADKPGKRLVIEDDRTLRAELDMVAGKPTVLSGVEAHRWKEIHYEAKVLGFVEVPVEVHFTLRDAEGERVVYVHDAGAARLRGDCVGDTTWSTVIPTPTGVPEGSFTIAPGPYTLTMDLVEKATGTKVPGSTVTLTGTAVAMPTHRVYFAGAFISDHTAADEQALVGKARAVAATYASDVPDFFPLAPGQASTVTRPIPHDLRALYDEVKDTCFQDFRRTRTVWNCEENLLRARVETRMRSGGWQMGAEAGQGDGAPSRVVVMITDADMTTLGRTEAIAFAPGTKGVFVKDSADHWDVAHEIVHTLPRHLWSRDEMVAACDLNYHNTGRFGTGIQVTHGGANQHEAHLQKAGLMGAVSASKDYWIEQCTYWHLLSALGNEVDPPLFMVQGIIIQADDERTAWLERGFSLDGSPDLVAGSPGDHAIVLRDAAGTELARYGFDLAFVDDEQEPLGAVSFGFAVPRVNGTASIVLVGPGGDVATRAVSATAPSVAISEPADGSLREGDGEVQLSWTGEDADGDALTYTVVASPDGATSWYDVATNVTVTELTVDGAFLEGDGDKVLRVTATDGVWSSTDEVHLTSPGEDDGDRGVPGPGVPLLVVGLLLATLLAHGLDRARGT